MSSDAAARPPGTPSPAGVKDDEDAIQRRTLRDYYIILRERLWVALPLAVIVALGYGYWKSRETPIYTATATMQFEKPETVVTSQSVVDPYIRTKADLYTYIQKLHSAQLFNRVVASFSPDQQKIIVRPALKKLPPGQPVPSVASMMGSMDASPIGETYFLQVTVTHQDPEAAALIANAYVNQFILGEQEALNGIDDNAVQQLRERVRDLTQQYQDDQHKIEQYIALHQNLNIASGENIQTSQLGAVNTQLEQARLKLIQDQNFLKEVQDYQKQGKDLLEISYISSQPSVASIAGALRTLRAKQATLSERYYERHPTMIDLANQIKVNVDLLAKAESAAIAELQATVRSEGIAEKALEDEARARNQDEYKLRNERIAYDALQLQADTVKGQLTQLSDRLAQTSTTQALEKIPIHKVDDASPNFAPVSPNLQRITRTSIMLGAFTFVAIAVGLSFIDDRIKSAWDIESFIGVTLLGIVPDLAALRTEEKYSLMLDGRNSAGVEPFLGIYSAIKIHSKLDYPKSLLITSTIPGEGKTLVSANLAGSFARHGKKTLLVDCDLRRPMLHRHYKQTNTCGVIPWFEAGANLEGKLLDNPHLGIAKLGENLWVLTSGGRSKTPTTMLEQPVFGALIEKLKKEFDLVVVDSPPMGAVSDALLIAERTDEIVYVCRFNRAYRKHIRLYMRTLIHGKHTVLGIVLNGLSPRRIEYYSNYRYYRSYKKYYGTQG